MDIDTIDRAQRKLRQAEGVLKLIAEQELPPHMVNSLQAVADLLEDARVAMHPPTTQVLTRVR